MHIKSEKKTFYGLFTNLETLRGRGGVSRIITQSHKGGQNIIASHKLENTDKYRSRKENLGPC